jgi:hypothetical protein
VAPLRLEGPPLALLGQVEAEEPAKPWSRMEKLTLAGFLLTAAGLVVYALK